MEIECQIRSVQQSLEKERDEPVSFQEAAAQWHQEIYSPVIREIQESRVIELFSGRTEADVFVWMWRWEPDLQDFCAQTSNLENGNTSVNSG
jgi:hypothetical protein